MKNEVYRVAQRYGLAVTVVANSWMRIPHDDLINLQVVGNALDAADDWIAEQVQANDIVITADILLASRCLKKDTHVIGTTGKPFTQDNIGDAVATRDLLTDLRSFGETTRGPAPLQKSDRSRFLQQLDNVIQSIMRENR